MTRISRSVPSTGLSERAASLSWICLTVSPACFLPSSVVGTTTTLRAADSKLKLTRTGVDDDERTGEVEAAAVQSSGFALLPRRGVGSGARRAIRRRLHKPDASRFCLFVPFAPLTWVCAQVSEVLAACVRCFA